MESSGGSPEGPALSGAAFNRFLERLDSNREIAGDKYMALYRKLELFFQVRRCEPDARSLCDTTLNRVMNQFFNNPDIDSAAPQAYALGVARFVAMEHWKKQLTLELKSDPPSPIPDDADNNEMSRHLSHCLEQLTLADRELAIRYYTYEKKQKVPGHRETARGADKSQGAIRIKLYRIRRTLRCCIERRLREG